MEKKYKEALQDMRTSSKKPSESFQTPWMYPGVEISAPSVQRAKVASTRESQSERSEVLEALSDFSREKLEASDSYQFEGGEIKRKARDPNLEVINSSENFEVLALKLKSFLSPELYAARFGEKYYQKGCRVVFVTDEYNVDGENSSELTSFFDEEVSLLFGRMITAMGLKVSDFFVSAIKTPKLTAEESRDLLLDEVFNLDPRFVVTLGATATNGFLGDQQRLKNIHGKLFDYSVTDQNDKLIEFKVMPLFSPKLLHTAPNMKKTAWKDMQILMDLL